VTIILGGDSLLHKKTKRPRNQSRIAATPRSAVRVRHLCGLPCISKLKMTLELYLYCFPINHFFYYILLWFFSFFSYLKVFVFLFYFSYSILLRFSSFFYIKGCNSLLANETWMNKIKYFESPFIVMVLNLCGFWLVTNLVILHSHLCHIISELNDSWWLVVMCCWITMDEWGHTRGRACVEEDKEVYLWKKTSRN